VTRLSYLRRDELDPAGQDVWDKVVGTRSGQLVSDDGALVGPFNAFVHAPEVGRRLASLGAVTAGIATRRVLGLRQPHTADRPCGRWVGLGAAVEAARYVLTQM